MQYMCYIVKMFCGVSEYETLFVNEQTLLFIANMFGNQKRSVVSAHVLMIDASKITPCVNEYKWIDTIETFSCI